MKKFIAISIVVIIVVISVLIFFKNNNRNDFKTTVKFSTWGSASEIKILKSVIDDFEKTNPTVKIELVHIPQSYFQKLHLLFASNLAPDVIFLNNYYLPLYAKANLLEDLSNLVTDDQIYFKESMNCFKYEGRVYAIPRDVSNLVIYYNKEIFDRYKIPYPTKDWTLEDLVDIGEKLTLDSNGDGKTDLFAINFEYKPVLFWLPYLTVDGGGIFSNNKIILDKGQSINALQFYANLLNKYKIAPSKSDSASKTSAQMFMNQELAMQLSGRWLVPKYRSDIKFDWDVVEFPKGKLGSKTPLDGSGWAVSKQSKHKKEALLFIKFLSSAKSISTFTKSGLVTPARKDIAYSNTFLDANQRPKNAVAFLNSIETGIATPVPKNYSYVTDSITEALEPVFSGEQQAKEIITKDFIEKIKKETF